MTKTDTLEVGDKIHCKGMTVTIAEIESQSNYGTAEKPCFYIEFRDTSGTARYWKQDEDGGHVIKQSDTELPTQHICRMDNDLKHITVFISGKKDLQREYMQHSAMNDSPWVNYRLLKNDAALFDLLDEAKSKGYTTYGDPRYER